MIARIWKTSKVATVVQLNPLDHGWDDEYHQKWSDIIFPNDITDLILAVEELEEDIADENEDEDSDDEELI